MTPEMQLHRPTTPVLVLDWGGVLSTPVQDAFDTWMAAAEIDPKSFMRVMREFHNTADSPLHRRERGEISVSEFELAKMVGRPRCFPMPGTAITMTQI